LSVKRRLRPPYFPRPWDGTDLLDRVVTGLDRVRATLWPPRSFSSSRRGRPLRCRWRSRRPAGAVGGRCGRADHRRQASGAIDRRVEPQG